MTRYAFIEAEKAGQKNVQRVRALLEVSRSAYYAWSKSPTSRRERADESLGEQIVKIHERSRKTYGAPRIHAELKANRVKTARKRVARLMTTSNNIAGRQRRRFKRTTIADPTATPLAGDLVQRNFSPDGLGLDQIYVGDVRVPSLYSAVAGCGTPR